MPTALAGDTCYAPDCTRLREKVRGGRLRYCATHRKRLAMYGTFDKQPTLAGQSSAAWKGDSIGYAAAHDRVRTKHGKPRCCVVCGADAAHWAYDHQDRAEKFGPDRPGGHVAAYSPNPDHYIEMCVGCHKRFDLTHLELIP